MEPTVSSEKIAAVCPHCGHRYRLPPNLVGSRAKCAVCTCVFVIQPGAAFVAEAAVAAVAIAAAAATPAPAAAVPVTPAGDGTSQLGVCPVCRTPGGDDALVECPDCHARHHQECWEYNGGCGKYGCSSAPEPGKIDDLEVPLAYWGQTEKQCPACGNVIQAAALRCRYCGIVFNTARPQGTGEFHAQRALQDDLPKLRRTIIWLLVMSIVPCSAALAAIVGGIWYAVNRRRIAALPVQHGAIAKIALVIAIVQTVLMLVVAALHGLLGH